MASVNHMVYLLPPQSTPPTKSPIGLTVDKIARVKMAATQQESTKLFIHNTHKIRSPELRDYFSSFGSIHSIQVYAPPRKAIQAIIRYEDALSARKALAASPHIVAGKKVSLHYVFISLIFIYR